MGSSHRCLTSTSTTTPSCDMETPTFTLGPERRQALPGSCGGFHVRINSDLRKCVVFFGHEDDTPGKGGINCVGTGFLVAYEGVGYLVTAKHLAQGLGGAPFLLRLNTKDGGSENLPVDGARWFELDDPAVDVSIAPFTLSSASPYDFRYLPFDRMSAEPLIQAGPDLGIGIGDLTYTIGLFRVLSGKKRNLPIVHLGSIAMMPNDERIPVRDWRDKSIIHEVEGYLVETQALEGLSGSPVFVRQSIKRPLVPPRVLLEHSNALDQLFFVAPRDGVLLFGLWQSSWDAPASDILAGGRQLRVPVGMGVVVPVAKIRETLNLEPLVEMRKAMKVAQEAAQAALAAE
ncbi:hypothetical protein SAMN05444161_3565 [Rhizobiales bacterium GAS191]|nr:hypothetical protein SAMN05444161_3565 [Rhizobiales bacterium GAS191]